MINKLGIFLASLLTVFQAHTGLDVPPPPPPKPYISVDNSYTARSIALFDAETSEFLTNEGGNKTVGIASLTKIMTSYVALKNLPEETPILISEDAIATSGSVGHFTEGEVFFLKDLVRALMMFSSNDAAIAIVESVGRARGGVTYEDSITIFVNLMNKEAENLGMKHTTFSNPTGLDGDDGRPSNYSTTEDLAKLIVATKEYPLIWEASRDTSGTIFSYGNRPHNLFNINEMVEVVPHYVGGKTGTTDASGESLVILYEYPLGHTYGFVLLGAQSGFRFAEARRLLGQVMPMLEI
ncbi:MAG: hypothetical protein O2794_01210 [bacterium]|nr:hypothetical protein [bacterium]